ncbi:MAG: serine/threonine-protein kinase [Bacillota bacterium]
MIERPEGPPARPGPAGGAGGDVPGSRNDRPAREVAETIPPGARSEGVPTGDLDRLPARDELGKAGQEFPLPSGEVIGGRYRLLAPHGKGGQSWVYRAEDTTGRHPAADRLALKLYKETVNPDREVMRVIAGLEHPGLLPILDHGWSAGRFYEVMPWAEGGSLLDRVETGGPLGVEELTGVVRVVNDVLEYCHRHNVVHADIKPANLFYLDPARTRLVVGDFGVAAHLQEGESLVPLERFTPGFLGPEAYAGEVGPPSDYHALGVTLIWLATGKSPWEGRERTEAGKRQIQRQILSGRLPVPDALPPRFQDLVQGLLIKERGERWGPGEVRRWLAGESVPVAERGLAHPWAPAPAPAGGEAAPGGVRSFLFEGVHYTDPVELARAMAERWEEARKRLYRGHVREWARTFDLDLANRLQDIEEEERDQNRGVHRMLGLLDPDGPYCYSGLVCDTPADLGRTLGEALASRDAAVELQVVRALESGTVEDWLRRLGDPERADRLRRLISRGLASDRMALWGVHYTLCPDEPLELDGVRFEGAADLAAHLAADWRGRAALATDPRILTWISAACGLEDKVAEWLRVAGDYESDPERGLAVFIALIHPGAGDDPAVLSPLRARVRDRLARVKEALDEHVFRGEKARQIEGEGRDLAGTSVEELGFKELMDLDLRARAWLDTCRRAEVSLFLTRRTEGVLTRHVYGEHVKRAAELAREAVARVEALREAVSRVGGSVRGLDELRARAERARSYEDHLAVVEVAVQLVEKIHRERAAELARVEDRRSRR